MSEKRTKLKQSKLTKAGIGLLASGGAVAAAEAGAYLYNGFANEAFNVLTLWPIIIASVAAVVAITGSALFHVGRKRDKLVKELEKSKVAEKTETEAKTVAKTEAKTAEKTATRDAKDTLVKALPLKPEIVPSLMKFFDHDDKLVETVNVAKKGQVGLCRVVRGEISDPTRCQYIEYSNDYSNTKKIDIDYKHIDNTYKAIVDHMSAKPTKESTSEETL